MGRKIVRRQMAAAFIPVALWSRRSKRRAGANSSAGGVVRALRIHGHGTEREPSAVDRRPRAA